MDWHRKEKGTQCKLCYNTSFADAALYANNLFQTCKFLVSLASHATFFCWPFQKPKQSSFNL